MSSWLGRTGPKRQFKPIEINKPEVSTIAPTINDTDEQNRINLFNSTNTDALITFIIPTINRSSLYHSIISLQNQKINNWKAIVIFDGTPANKYQNIFEILRTDNRFLYLSISKSGSINNTIKFMPHNSAGKVRNIGMKLVQTPWIGFLDDDDTLLDTYTEKLMEEIVLLPSVEMVIFRMRDKEYIFPPAEITILEHGKVGISFSFKTELFKSGFIFQQSEKEDFDFINNIIMANKKTVVSPNITYQVRDYNATTDKELKRIIFN